MKSWEQDFDEQWTDDCPEYKWFGRKDNWKDNVKQFVRDLLEEKNNSLEEALERMRSAAEYEGELLRVSQKKDGTPKNEKFYMRDIAFYDGYSEAILHAILALYPPIGRLSRTHYGDSKAPKPAKGKLSLKDMEKHEDNYE